MGPQIRHFYEYGFDAAVKQQSDPSFASTYDKESPLANLPPPSDFRGDPTRPIEEAWLLPVFKHTISSLLKSDLTLTLLDPMKDPLYPAIVDRLTSQEEACLARALREDVVGVEATDAPNSPTVILIVLSISKTISLFSCTRQFLFLFFFFFVLALH